MDNFLENIDFKKTAALPKEEIRDYIAGIESKMLSFPQVEFPLKHYFSKDVYAREMSAPAGALIVGKIHKLKNMSILSKGSVSILSVDGFMQVSAPYTFVSSPGVKRLIYVYEDVVWTTVHGTSETDLEKLEEELTANSYEEVLASTEIKLIDMEAS